MAEYVFSTSRGREVRFRGRAIAEAIDQIRTDRGDFTYFLTVYLLDGPRDEPTKFVAVIAATNYQLGIDYVVINECRNLKRAEDFFFVHECSDFWHDRGEQPPHDVDIDDLGDYLDPVFIELTHEVLDECHRKGSDRTYREEPKPPLKTASKTSLWSRLTGRFSRS